MTHRLHQVCQARPALPAMLLAASALVSGLVSNPAFAQDAASYPNKPIRIIVPFPAGGTADLLPRVLEIGRAHV